MGQIEKRLRKHVDPEEKTSKDNIYQQERPYKFFIFDEEVVSVFPDMISRSVPGYWLSSQGIGQFCKRYAQPNTNIYDLGCSLGTSTYSILAQNGSNEANIIAVDSSKEMIDHFTKSITQQFPQYNIKIHCGDICDIHLQNASVVILHYTLQFIPVEKRLALLTKIRKALLPDGVLLLSEKIRFDDDENEQQIRTWHHDYKAAQGYSEREIAQKARDIQQSMQTDTLEQLQYRLEQAGFQKTLIWMRCYGFTSFVVQK